MSTETKKLIEDLVKLEWDFFGQVQNEGGRASCQDDWRTFSIMRSSQFQAWNQTLLESRWQDLQEAGSAGRNPLTEKYGYMMCISAPEQNQALARRLPPVSEAQQELTQAILEILLPQNIAFREKFPLVAGRGRPLRTAEDGLSGTSIETYQRGELWTYSQRTLELLLAHLQDLSAAGQSYPELVISNSLRQRGYADLETAEAALRQRMELNPE